MSATYVERRTAPRRQPALGTVCDLASESGERLGTGLVWNISRSGVSMLLHRRLEPGTTIHGELSASGNGSRLAVTLQIAHIKELRTGDYILGGHFHRSLEQSEMRPFLG
jgi:hypothetical protein